MSSTVLTPGGVSALPAVDLVALVDESASREVYRVGALVLPLSRVLSLVAALDAVMASAETDYGIPQTSELHGHRIFHALEGWQGVPPRARIAVYGSALNVVSTMGDAVFIRGVHKRRHKERYGTRFDPHEAALMFTIEEVDAYAQGLGKTVLVVADECRFARAARVWLANACEGSMWGYRGKKIEMVKAIESVDSKDSRPVQAIDLITYLKTRISSKVDIDQRAARANDALWAKIDGLVRVDRVWYP